MGERLELSFDLLDAGRQRVDLLTERTETGLESLGQATRGIVDDLPA